jgi:hypothetical protein
MESLTPRSGIREHNLPEAAIRAESIQLGRLQRCDLQLLLTSAFCIPGSYYRPKLLKVTGVMAATSRWR